jgi:predicted NAD/FAD-dependent oxidoreductase
MNIVIVGAGIAGLACADALVAASHTVTLFDKGRAPGGRMATRRMTTPAGEVAFDHGAQYFTVRDPDFRRQALQWQAAGLAAPWPAAGPDAWVGTPSMAAPVRAMARPHDVRFPVQIDVVGRDGDEWLVDGAPFDTLAIALPAEQAATVLRPIQPAFADLAAQTPAAPCWTVMAAFPAALAGPDTLREDGPIGWAARNSAKPGRTGPDAWVIQAGPDWSRANLERQPADIVPLLLDALASRLGQPLPTPLNATAHRWRYARSGAQGSISLWDSAARLGLCGDWLLGPRVEAAWLSGRHLAAAILG